LGVFTGILPGAGPIAALFLAFIFKVNRASALLASLLTNTWLSLVTFVLAIKAGSAILGLDWHQVSSDFSKTVTDFNWLALLKVSVLKVVLPVAVGYLVISLALGLICYLSVLIILKIRKH